jgi:uridine kinase
MSSQQPTYSFDVLSYPRDSKEDAIVLDVSPESLEGDLARMLSTVDRIGRCATSSCEPADYAELAAKLDAKATSAVVIGDSEEQVRRAVAAGMGGILTRDSGGVRQAIDLLRSKPKDTIGGLYDAPLYTSLPYSEVTAALHRPDQIHTVGFIGRTGAGKSTTIDRLVHTLESQGGRSAKFEVDAFFSRSRKERRAWLNEPDISDEERAKRRRVTTWWDLGRAAETLGRIKQGEHVQLENLYDMQQGGEMVGTLDIDPGTRGFTVFVEGTALLIPELRDSIDTFVYFNTHDEVRAQFLMERNIRDGYTPEESHQRKRLTDKAETEDHIGESLRHLRYSTGNLAVLDNTERSNSLRLMPPFIPEK